MLQKVIAQLSPVQFEELHGELSQNRGEKFSRLLELYRNEKLEDQQIRDEISAKQAAFYTLKSRLFDKVQQYLFRTTSDSRAELLKNVSSVPFLVYNTPRETAVSLLLHLEAELKKEDMSQELVTVYNGLKTLHLHSKEYYHYQQQYNKNVAYMLALDKAEELVSTFMRELGDYLLSLEPEKIPLLRLYIRELANVSRLYESHRLRTNLVIASLCFAIFADEKNDVPETEETIEDLLQQLKSIIEEHPEYRNYKYLEPVRLFLNFEYYHSLGLRKNAQTFLEKLSGMLEIFLLSGHTCPASHVLLLKLDHESPAEEQPGADFALLFTPDPEDAFTYFNLKIYEASVCFLRKNYSEPISTLNELLNTISFKSYTFAEAQAKLFLTLSFLLEGKTDQAEIVLRSISRKLATDEFSGIFPAAESFAKFLKLALNDNSSGKAKKITAAWQTHQLINKGRGAILPFLRLDESQLKKLSE